MGSSRIVVLVFAASLAGLSVLADPEQIVLPEPVFQFGTIAPSEPIEHVFTFRNNTTQTLEPGQIKVTPPLAVPNISAHVPPGQEGMLRFRLGGPRPVGEYDGLIEVDFRNPAISNITFEVTGTIRSLIEAKPHAAFFAATSRGHSKTVSIELINRDQQPFQIEGVDYASRRFTLHLQTNEIGQRYTLSLELTGEGEAGRAVDAITVRTSNPKQPTLRIPAYTLIHERVHTFPEDVDFGTVRAHTPSLPKQVLMVYQDGGTNLTAQPQTDLPFLNVRTDATGGQVQVEISLKPEGLNRGPFAGHLYLLTNDPDFPKLEVPVKGEVE